MNKTACASVTVFVGAFLALILSIVAIAIPFWEYVKIDETASYYGLWRGCQGYYQYELCHSLDSVPTSMLVVRALEIFGVILLSIALLGRIVVHYIMRRSQEVFIWDGLVSVLSGLIMIAGTIVYGCITQKEIGQYSQMYDLDACFALCVVAGVVAITTGILRILIERKRKFSRHGTNVRMVKNQKQSTPAVYSNTTTSKIALVPKSQQGTLTSQDFNSETTTSTAHLKLPNTCENDNQATVSTPQPNPESIASDTEEPSSTHSLSLGNERNEPTEEIWEP